MRTLSEVQQIAGIYDFAVSGGDVGTIGLGVTIPQFAVIRSAYVVVKTLFDPVDITLSFGWDTGAVEETENALFVPLISAAFVQQAVLPGRDFDRGPVRMETFREVAITIEGSFLLAGYCQIIVNYDFLLQ